jgi:hypothetical protein
VEFDHSFMASLKAILMENAGGVGKYSTSFIRSTFVQLHGNADNASL